MDLESRIVLDGRFDLGSCIEFVTAQPMRVFAVMSSLSIAWGSL